VVLAKRPAATVPIGRDPARLLDLMLATLDS
jgi:hypothetical protein